MIYLATMGCFDYVVRGEPPAESDRETDLVETGDSDTDVLTQCPDDAVSGFAAELDDTCGAPFTDTPFDQVLEWTAAESSLLPGFNMSWAQPVIGLIEDDNGDGTIDSADTPSVVGVFYDPNRVELGGRLRALSGADGREIWAVPDVTLQRGAGVAVGDLDGDERPDVVAATPRGMVAVGSDGALMWAIDGMEAHIAGNADQPSMSDMNHDGRPEILLGNGVVSADGELTFAGDAGMGGPSGLFRAMGTASVAVDLDDDGLEELVTGNTAYRFDGSILWENGLVDGYPAIGNFDADPGPEIVVSAAGDLALLDSDGSLLWLEEIPFADSSNGDRVSGPPTIADFDGDGAPDIGVASSLRYTVFLADGSILWQQPADHFDYGNNSATVFDFEGDGVAEVVHADLWHLWVFDGRDGNVRLRQEWAGAAEMAYPIVVDVDADGEAELVVNEINTGGEYRLSVRGGVEPWMPARPVWNQHAFFTTNVTDDGTVPITPEKSWLTNNTFRGLNSVTRLVLPDLVVAGADVCELDCGRGRIVVRVHPGNEGALDLPASVTPEIELYAWGEAEPKLLDTKKIEGGIAAGHYLDSVVFDVSGIKAPIERLTVSITSEADECDGSDNVLMLDGPFCQ